MDTTPDAISTPYTSEALDAALAEPGTTRVVEFLKGYLDTLSAHDKANLISLSDTCTPERLAEMAAQVEVHSADAVLFVRVAGVCRRVRDAMMEDTTVPADAREFVSSLPREPYALPVVSPASLPAPLYDVFTRLCKGESLKRRTVGGWATTSRRPNEVLYPDETTVLELFTRGLIVPGIDQPWDGTATEYHLSAVGWRAIGCVYTDRTAAVELQVYEVADTPRDTDIARRFRAVTAEYRTRQARKDVSAGWNRWSEFDVTVPEKATGRGILTVTVLFEPAPKSGGADLFQFFGPVNAAGYHQHAQGVGFSVGKSVNQRAYDLCVPLCAAHASEQKAALTAARPVKPAVPPLEVVPAGEDVDALAESLGFI